MGRQIKNYRSWLDVENDKSLGNVVAVNHFTKGPTNRLARIIELQVDSIFNKKGRIGGTHIKKETSV